MRHHLNCLASHSTTLILYSLMGQFHQLQVNVMLYVVVVEEPALEGVTTANGNLEDVEFKILTGLGTANPTLHLALIT